MRVAALILQRVEFAEYRSRARVAQCTAQLGHRSDLVTTKKDLKALCTEVLSIHNVNIITPRAEVKSNVDIIRYVTMAKNAKENRGFYARNAPRIMSEFTRNGETVFTRTPRHVAAPPVRPPATGRVTAFEPGDIGQLDPVPA